MTGNRSYNPFENRSSRPRSPPLRCSSCSSGSAFCKGDIRRLVFLHSRALASLVGIFASRFDVPTAISCI